MHIVFLLRGGVGENVTQEIFKVMLEILVSKTANYRVSHNLCQTSSDNLKIYPFDKVYWTPFICARRGR